MRTYRALAILLTLLGLLTGCETAPTEELEQAQTTLAQADSVQAALYMPELYQEAQEALAASQEAMDAGNYDEARTLLEAARATAAKAARQARVSKEEMRTEAETLLVEAEGTTEHIAQAVQRTTNRSKRTTLQAGLRTIEAALEDARDAMSNEDIPTALERAREAHEEANALMTMLMEGKSTSWND